MFNLLCIVLIALLVHIAKPLKGPNVCITEKSTVVEIMASYHQPYEVITIKWCWHFPPWNCRKKKTAFRIAYRKESRVRKKEQKICCKGYLESKNKCIPNCIHQCIFGTCIKPEKCKCNSGWSGKTCNEKN